MKPMYLSAAAIGAKQPGREVIFGTATFQK